MDDMQPGDAKASAPQPPASGHRQPSTGSSIAGEVQVRGALVKALAQACVNLNLLVDSATRAFLDGVEPNAPSAMACDPCRLSWGTMSYPGDSE